MDIIQIKKESKRYMIYKSEIKFFIILEIKKLEELSKNTYVEIIQKPNHISILIKSRISNSQKDNWLDLSKIVYQYHREICGIFLFIINILIF